MKSIFNICKKTLLNEDLSKYTTMRVGGKAKYLCLPESKKEIVSLIKFCKKQNLPYFLLGNGSNVIFSDNGFNGMIICLKNYCNAKFKKNKIICQSGLNLFKLNALSANSKLKGMEWSYGIPGTIGGAVSMNAGAYGCCIADFVKKVKVFNGKKVVTLNKNKLQFSYRNSVIKQNNWAVLKVVLVLKKGHKETIKKQQLEYFNKRKLSQPLEKFNSGSIFKNTNTLIAGKTIDNQGLKGVKIGGAEVSPVHANFIVNNGNATASDVISLIRLIQENIKTNLDQQLETEIVIIED